jgi:Na+/alanine symporter
MRFKKSKKPLSNGVYSAKNARRDGVIKIQRAEIDSFFVCSMAGFALKWSGNHPQMTLSGNLCCQPLLP